jgi:hypothetical protein
MDFQEVFEKMQKIRHNNISEIPELLGQLDGQLHPEQRIRLIKSLYGNGISPNALFVNLESCDDLSLNLCMKVYESLDLMRDINIEFPPSIAALDEVVRDDSLFDVKRNLLFKAIKCFRSREYVAKSYGQELVYNPQIKFIMNTRSSRNFTICYFMACSVRYFCQLYPLIAHNISRFMGDGLVHIHIITPDTKSVLIDHPVREFNNVMITASHIDESRVNEATYYHAFRYMLLPWIIDLHRLPLMYVGSDPVFKSHASSLILNEPEKIGYFQGFRQVPWRQINADTTYFPYNSIGKAYAKAVANYIAGCEWEKRLMYLDQVALVMVYNYMKTILRIDSFHDFSAKMSKVNFPNAGGDTLDEKLQRGIKIISAL